MSRKRKIRLVRNPFVGWGQPRWVHPDYLENGVQADKQFYRDFFSGRFKAESKIQRFAMLFIGLWFITPVPVGLLEYLLSHQSVFQREPISICILLPFTLFGFFCLLNYINNLRVKIDDNELP